MSRPLKNITLNEGFNDLGTQQIEVTEFEFPVIEALNAANNNAPQPSWNALFKADYSNGAPLPVGSKVEYNVYIKSPDIEYTSELYTTLESAFSIPVPQFPFVHRADDNIFYIDIRIEGEYTARNEEIFLEVNDPEDNTRYTPFTNLVTDGSGVLGVKSSVGDFYDLAQNITIDPGYDTLVVGSDGTIYCFDDATETWTELVQLTFVQFEDPSALIFITDGIYEYDAGAGTISTGNLEETSTGFESFSAAIPYPEPGYVSIDIDIFGLDPVSPIYSDTFNKVMPGSQNFNLIEIAGSPSTAPDESPDLDAIETVSGVTFTTVFKDFLENNNYDTLNAIRKAGPIMYIKDFPAEGWTPSEVELLQSHVDLYTINQDIDENQHLIDFNFGSLYGISTTPRDEFINTVEGANISRFKSAQVHELTIQNQKMTSNLLAARLTDYHMADNTFPVNPDSDFASEQFASFLNKCDCDECTSSASPFAYLVDLLKYGARHIKKTTATTYAPTNYNAFITLLENYFLQPFGSLAVSCDTLHEEYCRVRLVTEVLEKYVDNQTLPPSVEAKLAADRDNFLMLTYQSILKEIGTSLEEIRDVYANQVNKLEAVTALTKRLGIPVYDPVTSDYTTDIMWLSFGNSDLTADNLESIFGFRETTRDVLTPTPEGDYEKWKKAYLNDVWKEQDYPLSIYTREGVVPGTLPHNPSWMPIIDPDMIGQGDFTYLKSSYTTSMWNKRMAFSIWQNRKADTDTFLHDILNDSNLVSRTSVDLNARILKVQDRDISTDVLYNDKIEIQNPSSSNFEEFTVLDKELNGTNTNVVLVSATPGGTTVNDIFQPEGPDPVMRYNRVVNVESSVPESTSITLTWTEPVLRDYLDSPLFLRMTSDNSADIYGTDESAPYNITSVTFNSEYEVEFTVGTAPTSDFVNGNVTFVCSIEVPLVTDTIVDPVKVCEDLFTNDKTYTFLSPYEFSGSTDYNYFVWETPSGWSSNYYDELVSLYNDIQVSGLTENQRTIIEGDLHMEVGFFTKMMETLISIESYLNNSYTVDRPENTELFDLASIFRSSAKTQLQVVWVAEEIDYYKSGSSPTLYLDLQLDGRYFWKTMNEPEEGVWGPSLQTIPDDFVDVTEDDKPIIDPEIYSIDQFVNTPETKPYRDLYDLRKGVLDTNRAAFIDKVTESPFNPDGFVEILNKINTNSYSTGYTIPDYTDLDELITDFESNDAIKVLKATNNLKEAFGFTKESFEIFLPIRNKYQDNNANNHPSIDELKEAVDIAVTGYKISQLYFPSGGWIEEEIDGDFTDGSYVHYYNVLKMAFAPYRANLSNRTIWQDTLHSWNNNIIINPDIVPPENIKEFIDLEAAHDIWVDRYDDIDALKTTLEDDFDPNTQNTGTLMLAVLEKWINMAIARTDDDTIANDFTPYFLALETIEEQGTDIRPYLSLYGITITEYRILRKSYDVLENDGSNPPSLIDSEYEDLINIFIAIRTQVLWAYDFRVREYNEDIILSGADFEIFKPSPVNFPLTNIKEYNKFRSPVSLRNEWNDKLETRISRLSNEIEEITDLLFNVEEISMPVLRDALINALRNDCESLDEAASRLAQTLFIETKDNCCVKHSRVSHAFETIQGLFFSLENGVYNNYLDGFELIAPNFDQEWEWLGSYATWRSAVFTFIFPENLLHPTLKRLQSPGFRQLNESIKNSNRLSEQTACQLGNNFDDYYQDILNLDIVCTATSRAIIEKYEPFQCCEKSDSPSEENTTFYFAKSYVSNNHYWSRCIHNNSSHGDHSFWLKLPLPQRANLIGCFVISNEYDSSGNSLDRSLWLFYSYKDGGVLKLVYIKKPLLESGDWSGENEIDLPEDSPEHISKLEEIIPVQEYFEWDNPAFIFKYRHGESYRYWDFSLKENDSSFLEAGLNQNYMYSVSTDSSYNDLQSIKLFIETPSGLKSFTLVINTHTLYTRQPDSSTYIFDFYQVHNFSKIVGVFHDIIKPNNHSTIVILGVEASTNEVAGIEISFTVGNDGDVIGSPISIDVSNNIKEVDAFLPRFAQQPYLYYGAAVSKRIYFGTRAYVSGGPSNKIVVSTERFALKPTLTRAPHVLSFDCISNLNTRKQYIEQTIKENLNPPIGTPPLDVYYPPQIKTYIYEAYYYVPMYIALTLQSKGLYESALDWYRSIYNYADNITNHRKLFYGLVIEESINNVYQRPSDWLLDPLNPHAIAETRANAYTQYTVLNIVQCMLAFADREFTFDTSESVPRAKKLYTEAKDLLQISELQKKTNECNQAALDCLPYDITLPYDGSWNNSFVRLQQNILQAKEVSTIQSLVDQVGTIFNDDQLTIEEKFSDSFAYVKNNIPTPSSPSDVTTVIEGIEVRMDNAYRFLTSTIELNNFNTDVSDGYLETLSQLTFISKEEIIDPANEEKIAWLKDPVPDNAASFDFKFINDEGIQRLPDGYTYNPLEPNSRTYYNNFINTNATSLVSSELFRFNEYSPFLDYNFCIPQNSVYESLELKANLELYKILNCRNIAGMMRSLDVYAAPTDTTTGVPYIGASGNLVLPGLNNFTPSQYRFTTLIERAKNLVNQAQQLENQFLSAIEKYDAESYSQLRAQQDLETSRATVKLQDLRVIKANDEKVVAETQLSKSTYSWDTFDNRIASGLNPFERASLDALQTSKDLTLSAAIIGAVASATASDPRSSTAAVMNAVIAGLSSSAQIYSISSNISSQLASYARRTEEWIFQRQLADFDIQIANQQIKIAEDNVRIVSQERKIAQLNTDHAQETLEFLKNKFTNAEFYWWMGNVLERSYSYMLSLATAVARSAEQQFYFEQQEPAGPFILDDYWETTEASTAAFSNEEAVDRRGITGSARLLKDITRLDQYAFENTKRKLQLNKTISISQLFPEEFQNFRQSGVLTFDLTNKLFDYDFPGHYLRLVKGIKVTVIGLTPVYDGIKATLTATPTSYTVVESNGTFQKIPVRRLEVDQIALTSPAKDDGLFEMQPMQGQLLNPFEGMGIESHWEFKMPKFSNRMDFDQIADVVIEIEYTAIDNYQYRYQVLQEISNTYNFSRGFSLKNDFADQWYELSNVIQGNPQFEVTFEVTREMFPQGISNIQLDGTDVLLYFVREDGFTNELSAFDFTLSSGTANLNSDPLTTNGLFKANNLTNNISEPFHTYKLTFANTAFNRALFEDENISDILLLFNCKAELNNYPL